MLTINTRENLLCNFFFFSTKQTRIIHSSHAWLLLFLIYMCPLATFKGCEISVAMILVFNGFRLNFYSEVNNRYYYALRRYNEKYVFAYFSCSKFSLRINNLYFNLVSTSLL